MLFIEINSLYQNRACNHVVIGSDVITPKASIPTVRVGAAAVEVRNDIVWLSGGRSESNIKCPFVR